MKLQTLKINNFCCIKSLELTPNGSNVSIYGDNATGKTTLVNAFMWLFTGKNSNGTADLDPQPLDRDNNKLHNLETSVEAVTDLDGATKTFKRVLTEVWTKKRGCLTEQLTGTSTAYYIDGVPMKESEYKSVVSGIADPELFKMLSVVSYFPSMDWKQRRNILLQMCGDVSEQDVINSDPELAPLSEFLQNGTITYTVEQFSKIAKSKKADLKREIDLIPARISENENAIPELKGEPEQLMAEIKELEQQKQELQDLDAVSGGAAAKAQLEAEIKAEMAKAESEYFKEISDNNCKINDILLDLNAKRADLEHLRSGNNVELANVRYSIKDKSAQREKLLAEYAQIEAEAYSGDNICPTCGQPLPPEKVEEAQAAFNRRKSERKEEISRKGKECSKTVIAELNERLATLEEKNLAYAEEISSIDAEISEYKSRLRSADFRHTEKYAEYQSKLENAKTMPTSDHAEEIKALSERIMQLHGYMGSHIAADNHKKRIAELTEQQRTLGEELARCEQGEYLCEQFIKAKISLLDERINSRFRTLKFKLFHQQQNGGIAEICKVLIPCESGLVEYEKANNAAKINAGLELIDVLSAHFGTALPVFVDNAESVTKLEPVSNQLIRLYVSEQDKSLRWEHE